MIDILPTDTQFNDSPGVGPGCLCSRCNAPILDGIPIRFWHSFEIEYRFHPECMGMRVIQDIQIELMSLPPEVEAQCLLIESACTIRDRLTDVERRNLERIEETFYDDDQDLSDRQKQYLDSLIKKYPPE